ncbi:MAG: putative nucleic acid-binding protein [Promethearchaeota archaeon CR_4]|nr:MAG: putative nucleic acid-binding protein [Candidatus Lokiarchaeota archaeon CR_4]
MTILDTDVLVAYLRKKDFAVEFIQHLRKKEEPLKTTVFNAAELFKGCYAMKNVAKGLKKVQALVESLAEVLPFDDRAIQEYAKLAADLKNRGKMIGAFDELIGSICIANGETLYTKNVRHFENIEEIKIINWFEMIQKLSGGS